MNFQFLKDQKELEPLYRCCHDAESFAWSRPDISITEARKALEFMIKLLYGSKIQADFRGMTLFEILSDYDFMDYLSDETLVNQIHFVRKQGNLAVHEGYMTSDMAVRVVEALHYVVGEICIKMQIIDRYHKFDAALMKTEQERASREQPTPEIDPALVEKIVQKMRLRLSPAGTAATSQPLKNIHQRTSQRTPETGRAVDSGANGKTAYQLLARYFSKVFDKDMVLMENVKSEITLVKGQTVCTIAVKTGCSNIGKKDRQGNWNVLEGIDYVLYAPEVLDGIAVESQFYSFTRQQFYDFWNELGLIRYKISTAQMKKCKAELGADVKLSIDEYSDVISIQSFTNSNRKKELVQENLKKYPLLRKAKFDFE